MTTIQTPKPGSDPVLDVAKKERKSKKDKKVEESKKDIDDESVLENKAKKSGKGLHPLKKQKDTDRKEIESLNSRIDDIMAFI